jgi:hypothetical protein
MRNGRSPCKSRPEKQDWMIDFPCSGSHLKGVHSQKSSWHLPIPFLLLCVGCTHLSHTPKPGAGKHPEPGIFQRWCRNLAGLHPLAGKATPPKAQALVRVGTVRTVSKDGSYVIAELDPGMMVATGNFLLVTETGGEPARLKVAEITSPFFVADIEQGSPQPGDPLRQ